MWFVKKSKNTSKSISTRPVYGTEHHRCNFWKLIGGAEREEDGQGTGLTYISGRFVLPG